MTRKPNMFAAAAARTAPGTPAPGETAISTNPIRTTVDLEPGLWGDLQTVISTMSARRRGKIRSAQVLRALVWLVVNDPSVADKVSDHIMQS